VFRDNLVVGHHLCPMNPVPDPSSPLAGLRVAATLPPPAWFGGVDRKFAVDMIRNLEEMGADLLQIDIARLVAGDPAYVSRALSDLRTFQPDVALGTPNAGYAMLAADSQGRNLFRDILEIPTLLIWDHGVLQFAGLILQPLPNGAQESSDGCIGRLRKALDHPLFLHYSPDRGHTSAMRRLGVLVEQPVQQFLHVAFPAYTRPVETNPAMQPRIAFAGNLYFERARSLKYRQHETLGPMEAAMLTGKAARPQTSLWELLIEQIDQAGEAARRELCLNPDQSFFWRFVCDEIESVGSTEVRLSVLTALRHEFDFYGNFVEPQARALLRDHYGIRFREMLDCVTELPALYRSSRLLVDAVQPCYISGVSPKIPSCYAAGGMALFDYKSDFRDSVGDIADQVMYRDHAHLNAMIEDFLSRPEKRNEVVRELQHRVLEQFTFAHLMRRMLVEEPLWRMARSASAS
jgi:Glycosyl transferases group 1